MREIQRRNEGSAARDTGPTPLRPAPPHPNPPHHTPPCAGKKGDSDQWGGGTRGEAAALFVGGETYGREVTKLPAHMRSDGQGYNDRAGEGL